MDANYTFCLNCIGVLGKKTEYADVPLLVHNFHITVLLNFEFKRNNTYFRDTAFLYDDRGWLVLYICFFLTFINFI